MLVLTRKAGQAVLIQGGISITVCRIEGDRVHLGIEAPEGVGIARAELIAEPVRDNEERTASAGAG